MTTTKDLICEHNDLARELGIAELTHWKQSGETLRDRIDAMRSPSAEGPDPLDLPGVDMEAAQAFDDAEAAETIAEAPKAATELRIEPEDAPEPSAKPWTIGAMVKELLLDPNGYDYAAIVALVRAEFPTASTSTRSVASVAAALRRDGQVFPMRKPRNNA